MSSHALANEPAACGSQSGLVKVMGASVPVILPLRSFLVVGGISPVSVLT